MEKDSIFLKQLPFGQAMGISKGAVNECVMRGSSARKGNYAVKGLIIAMILLR